MLRKNSFVRIQGFTLMELIIAVAIVGIIAAIAYPNYIDRMYKSRRSDGQSALLNLASYMEAFYTENSTYAGATLANLGLTNASPQGYYTISINTATANAYSLTATPVVNSPQAGDSCGALTLTNTNIKGPSINCWQ